MDSTKASRWSKTIFLKANLLAGIAMAAKMWEPTRWEQQKHENTVTSTFLGPMIWVDEIGNGLVCGQLFWSVCWLQFYNRRFDHLGTWWLNSPSSSPLSGFQGSSVSSFLSVGDTSASINLSIQHSPSPLSLRPPRPHHPSNTPDIHPIIGTSTLWNRITTPPPTILQIQPTQPC